MSKQWKNLRRTASLACVAALTLSLLSGCGSKSADSATTPGASGQPAATKEPPIKVTFMTSQFSGDPVVMDSQLMKQVGEYCNAQFDIQFVPNTGYTDKLNITLASGSLPMVLMADTKSASVVAAIRNGAFWEIGPLLKNYKNLSQANPIVLNNSSVDGKTYGLYRARALGRNGVVVRKDWLENVGMKIPTTIDEFYEVLKAFATKDPDKNGKNDTYGMVVTKYNGPFMQMLTWFGAPNGWGEEGGKLVPAHLTKEYMDCLKFFKKLYDEKLINQDFAIMDPAKWNDPVIQNKAGLIVDVTDRSNKLSQDLAKLDPKYTVDVFGTVKGPKGERVLATAGYSGMFLFSKSSIKDEATLKRVLTVMDKTSDKKMQDMLGYGIEGRHFKYEENAIVPSTDTTLPKSEFQDANQILSFIGEKATPLKQTDIVKKYTAVQEANEKLVVGNPAAPFMSQTYATKGAQLDNIIEDARVQFIVGKIDEAGFNKAVELWKKSGGDDYVKEINDEYVKTKK